LARLGVAGVSALLGRNQTTAAREGAQQGRQEIEAVAAPYRQQGLQLQAQAQRGELTPQAQQSLQAVQAQAAQQAQRRGGVGVAQSQQQIENFRQQLLAQQYDLGLKISGIGDQIALGAIRTGMQADQYVNQLTGSYYGNIARSLYGAAPQAQQPGVA
jgi:orotidine-5'-phosphate decarboxylase